ncbi:hypothetical protein [Aquimarina sp. AU474]|uniref:hypothetical protein n=1 Tax=Aquimarina sp. AU474 TaxID=2108529 RepID=UPI0013593C1C|nr:hypothetical protein [Aquimarina sp. AU474]
MKSGDLVKLKDGNAHMNVIGVDESYVICEWQNKLNAPMRGSFPRHIFELITDI